MPFGYRLVRDADYDKLVATCDRLIAENKQAVAAAAADGARAEFLRIHANALEQDAARLRAVVSGVPHVATSVEPRPLPGAHGRGIGIPGMDVGIFTDIDELAEAQKRGDTFETLTPVANGVQHATREGVN